MSHGGGHRVLRVHAHSHGGVLRPVVSLFGLFTWSPGHRRHARGHATSTLAARRRGEHHPRRSGVLFAGDTTWRTARKPRHATEG